MTVFWILVFIALIVIAIAVCHYCRWTRLLKRLTKEEYHEAGDKYPDHMFHREWTYIRDRRENIKKAKSEKGGATRNASAEETEQERPLRQVGLCLSGGGIRSATFNLGVIQALQRVKFLEHVDYLSTVSGGGYIGSCLMNLLSDHREPAGDCRQRKKYRERILDSLSRIFHHIGTRIAMIWPLCRGKRMERIAADPDHADQEAVDIARRVWGDGFPFDRPKHHKGAEEGEEVYRRERAPVRWLRYYSNYLTAENSKVYKVLTLGILFIKGFMVNLLVILPYLMLAAFGLYLLLLAGAAVPDGSWLNYLERLPEFVTQNWYGLGLVFVLVILLILVVTGKDTQRSRWNQNRFLSLVLGVLLALIVIHLLLSVAVLDLGTLHKAFGTFSLWSGIALVAGILLLAVSAVLPRVRSLASSLVSLVLQLFVYAFLMFTVFSMVSLLEPTLPLEPDSDQPTAQQIETASEAEGAKAGEEAMKHESDILFTALAQYMQSAWPHVMPLLDAPSSDEVSAAYSREHWRYHIPLAAFVLMVLLWFLTDIGVNINKLSYHNLYRDRLSQAYMIRPASAGEKNNGKGPDEAKISLYDPEKIIRDDGLLLSESGNGGWAPYHIINTTMNLSKKLPGSARDMDQQNMKQGGVFRRGENFILSRYFVGSKSTGYLDTKAYEAIDRHMDLASAMAISGAALNVTMAEKTVSRFRLLFSLLNVRLGYWAMNPFRIIKAAKDIQVSDMRTGSSSADSKQESVPLRRWKAFWYRLRVLGARWTIAREWFGRYGTRDMYVNISDGGHFDNLGVYELLKRRCEFIVVSDAEADPAMSFKALSGIIRLARVDLGVDIDIDVKSIWKDASTGYSPAHCAVGTITYANGTRGYLLYLKSSLTGDEPQHLHEYRVANPSFPHQTTADQWFDERQFEVYRELGYHIAKQAMEFVSFKGFQSLDVAFLSLKQYWRSSSLHTEEMFTKHTAELSKIMDILREEDALEFMDAQIVRDWKTLSESNETVGREKSKSGTATASVDASHDATRGLLSFWDAMRKGVEFLGRIFDSETGEVRSDDGEVKEKIHTSTAARNWLPKNPLSVRKGFYLCSRMLQLMEDVYTDLNLEEEWDHPDNRGWINQFRFWSQSSMFKITWAMTASTYGARFRDFCERLFDMQVIKADTDTLIKLSDSEDPPFGSLMEACSFEGCNQGCDRVKQEKYQERLMDCRKADLINPLEFKRIMKYIVAAHIDFGWLVTFKYRIEEEYPEVPASNPEHLDFRYAIALIGREKPDNGNEADENKLIFFRVQNQLRGIGLGRAALRVLHKATGVKDISMAFHDSLTHKAQRYPGHPTYRSNDSKLRRMLESVICECDEMTQEDRNATGPTDATLDARLDKYIVSILALHQRIGRDHIT